MFRLQRSINFDNNATTVVSKRVRKRMGSVLRRHHGNPSALYGSARCAAAILEESREAVARAVSAEADEIFFTSGATEANNQVLKVLAEHHHPSRSRILTTPIEHPSIVHTLGYLEAKGIKVEFIPVAADGRVLVDRLEEQIDENTFLICCMLANNELGTIQDLPAISAIARRHGIAVLSDCAQALGKIPVDVNLLGVDYATFSAHKLHGPKGVGALFLRRNSPIAPLLHGGHQEGGLRAGTEAVHDIAGFAEACRGVPDLLAKRETVAARKDFLLAELKALKPDLIVNSPARDCLPNTLNLSFPGVNNAVLMGVLDMYGIAISLGSACSTSETTPSHVLSAIGLTDERASETIRISLSDETSATDLRRAIRVFRDFFENKTPSIPLLRPSQVHEAFLYDEKNFILDVRFEIERKLQKGLPNSHNASVISFGRYLHQIPKNRNIVVVCSVGIDASSIAYSLHKRGYRSVAVLLGGIVGWQLQQPKLYQRLGGKNITKIEPRGRSRNA